MMGYNQKTTDFKEMLRYSSETSNLLKANGIYYEVLHYNMNSCNAPNESCVVNLIQDINGSQEITYIPTINTSKYKEGYWDGLHEGVDLGWDICDSRRPQVN